jgi:hypothetical protein
MGIQRLVGQDPRALREPKGQLANVSHPSGTRVEQTNQFSGLAGAQFFSVCVSA